MRFHEAAVELGGLEFAFPHHPFMLLARAFDAVSILAILIGKPPDDFVGIPGRIAKSRIVVEPDPLPGMKSMDHDQGLAWISAGRLPAPVGAARRTEPIAGPTTVVDAIIAFSAAE
jgi:hypothetical protein